MKELVSVIVPVYNVELYIRRCIDSIIAQTYINLEIILIDDGSTDKSGNICDEYKDMDKRIIVIHKKNGGLSSARNKGLEIAKGRYIGFVDSDDYIDKDMFEVLLSYMEDEVDIVACGRYLIYPKEDKKINKRTYCTNKVERFNNFQAIKELLKPQIFPFGVVDKVYKRELFDNIKFPVGRISEDIPVTYALFKKSRNIIHIGECKYYNYQSHNSITRSDFYYRRIDYVLFIRDILLDVRNNFPELIEISEFMYVESIAFIISCIRLCKEREKYKDLEKRLIYVLSHMYIRILCNKNIPKINKKTYLLEIIEYYNDRLKDIK